MAATCARIEHLSHRYGRTCALDDVSLSLPIGKVTVLLGPNGAGKTTLIKMMLGLVAVRHGRITVLGGRPNDRLVRQRIGAMLQIGGVPEKLTVCELIELFASFYPAPLPGAEVAQLAGIEALAERRFEHLSGGQRQKTLLALALVGRPQLLILDEPGNGLDPASRRELGAIIRDQAASGTSIVLCTHDLDEAARLADHIVIMNHGRMLTSGHPDTLSRAIPTRRIRCHTRLPVQALRGLPGCRQAEVSEQRAEVLVTDAPSFLRALLAADPHIDDLEVTGADLETAFLSLTQASREQAA
ncbi:MAG: ABC transporter ATP-binding protein [Wenzhouxiangella sp.]|nr:MAG: ABC transporter ATP-binding protein [Wenzhouxiangella sp.]